MDSESEIDYDYYLDKENEENEQLLPGCGVVEKNVSFWSTSDTRLLLHIFKQKGDNSKKGHCRQGQLWEMIAKEINKINPTLGKTAIQCSNKLACLKRTYKNIKDHNKKSGNSRKSWPFYEEMDEMFGNRAWVAPKCVAEVGCSQAGPSSSSSELSYSSSSLAVTEPKRKRKTSLEDVMNQTKTHHEEKKLREEKKLEMFDKFREERLTMHKEKMKMQQKLLDVMTQIYSGNNTHN